MKNRLHPLLLPLALAMPLAAHAGRPFVTEDAGVLSRAQCEWEGLVTEARADGEAAVHGWGTQVACGIGWRTQLALGVAQARSQGTRAESLGLGGKTALAGHPDGPVQWTLAYGLSTTKAPGSSHKLDGQYVNLVLTGSPAKDWTAHANLGFSRSKLADSHVTTWAVAAERAMGGGWDLGAELYGDSDDSTFVGLGARWQVAESFSLNASLARATGSGGARLFTLGFKFSF